MHFREIPSPQWATTLGNFGLHHFGWNVTLAKKSLLGGELLTDGHAFLEELATGGLNYNRRITIVLGSPFHPFHTHVVDHARRLRVAAAPHSALEIESSGGRTFVIHCRRPTVSQP